ncbi:hypothetical protein F511_25960 [Dorcoceras hygrometricum]|uniref:PB1 domain-containing protein n=1 Tax=Dorcoceras hygrometricum TaxID=472368 RepID=A0A2Z7CM42_9LAMI|nr:hypothetical protein F511_25960 [Dorcoceras hygrometricum]
METVSGSGSSNFTFLGSCEYKDELYMISICNGFSLMELFLTLGRKCEEISPQNVILQYLAPHRKLYVTLNEDDDVRNMTHLHTCMRLTIIDMRAVKKTKWCPQCEQDQALTTRPKAIAVSQGATLFPYNVAAQSAPIMCVRVGLLGP